MPTIHATVTIHGGGKSPTGHNSPKAVYSQAELQRLQRDAKRAGLTVEVKK